MRSILLDTFCGAGGCTRGYQDAGFFVVGVDIHPQPRYVGDGFILADALDILRRLIGGEGVEDKDGRVWRLGDFALIHASPPCQAYSVTSHLSNGTHPDLVEPVRDLLIETGRPYVIENVPNAPLINPLMLCGTMFGLRVIRHRLFECHPPLWFPPATCCHDGKTNASVRNADRGDRGTISLEHGFRFLSVAGNNYLADEGRQAMGIDWMPKSALSQAIPPAYTEYIGHQMLAALEP